jgi:hypothetical protein
MRGAEQEAGSGTILARGDRVLVVTAGGGDRGGVATRMLEQLGASCVLLDVSSAGNDPQRLSQDVRDAYEQLSGGASRSTRRMAIAGVGLGAGPALTAAAALGEHAAPPCVLIVNGRFDAGPRSFAALGIPTLLLHDRDRPRRERGAQRAIARELGADCELVVVGSLAEDGDAVLRSWRARHPVAPLAPSEPDAVAPDEPEVAPARPRLHAVPSGSRRAA